MFASRAIVLSILSAGTLWAQLPVYHVTDLGALTGTQSGANGISNNGTYVTGTFSSPPSGPVNQAFLWSSATGAVALGTLGGVSISTGVNNTGQVSGYSVPSQNHAFLYSSGAMMDLGTLSPGLTSSFGLGINNSGQVVGYANPSASNFHQYDPFLYSGSGPMQDLGLPPGTSLNFGAAASAINDNGVIVGYFTPDSASTHPFLLSGGKFTDLGSLEGNTLGANAAATGISSNGLISGSSSRADGTTHGFLYTGGKMVDLGTLAGATSRAQGVNSNSDVVGYSTWSGSSPVFHGFLYHNGVMLDLNNLLDVSSAGYTITDGVGTSVSENGVIAATGTTPGGATHALLLTPVSSNSQTISFDAIPNQIFGISPFPIAAQASSGLAVTLTSTTPTVCKTATGLVTLLGAGTCTINATQNGSIAFSPALPVTHSFTVSLANVSGSLQPSTASPLTVGTQPRSVVVGDFNGDGFPDLATANYGDGTVTVLLANGTGGYTAATGSPFPVGTNPQSLAVGDFNGDGFQDLAVANSGSNNVTVLLGNGLGGFAAAAGGPITVGLQPVSIVVGDFNGDAIQDLAVANFSAGNVTLLLGNGSGGFTAAVGGPLAVGTNPLSVAVGDFNGDGLQDLAVANFGSGNVTVWLGVAGGVMAPAAGSPFTVGSSPYSVVVGDFTGDGKADLATANSGSNNVTVLAGNGSGGFSAVTASPFAAGTNPYALVVGDFNGDGFPDIAAANYGSNNVTLLLGNGTGGFAPIAGGPITVGNSPFSLAVADFNGDGISDLGVANYGAGNVTLLLGGKDNTTSVLSTLSPLLVALNQTIPLTLVVSDNAPAFHTLTGAATLLDGSTVVATATQTTSPYTFSVSNLAAGSHSLSARYAGDSGTLGSTSNTITIQVSATLTAQTITFGPLANQTMGTTPPALNGTASSALALSYTSNSTTICTVSGTAVTLVSAGTCSITANQGGNATFAPAFPVTATFLVLAAQTITFDTIPNQIFGISPFLAAAKSSAALPVAFVSNTPSICSNASTLIMPLATGTCSITASGSGNAANGAPAPVTRTFTVLHSPGAASLTQPTGSPFPAGTGPHSVAVGDVDGDGNLDLLIVNQATNNVTVLLGNGSGSFAAAASSPVTVGMGPLAVVVGDFNADGVTDFATANATDGTVTVMLGTAGGGFAAAAGNPFTVGKKPSGLAVGDFNDDGIQDLAVINNTDGTVSVLLGNGSGGFTPSPGNPFPAGASATAVAVADFNGDGIQDLVIADEGFNSTTAVVLLGNGSGGFTAATGSPFNAGLLPSDVVVGDFNGDGVPDFAAPSLVFNNVTVNLGKKSGGFTMVTATPSTGANPSALVVGDFNGDGIPDLASADTGAGTVTLLLGNGQGGFAPAVGSPLTVGSGPNSLMVGDFNKDGVEDLAVANGAGGNVTVLMGGSLTTSSLLSTSSPATIVAGQSVPLVLAVLATGAAFGPLGGTATFYDGTTALGTATQTTSPYGFSATLAVGSHTLTGTFGGGGGGLPSTSNAIPILVLSPCDLNQDGSTNVSDVQLGINEILGTAKANNDLDGSGAVSVVDGQIVINAAIGRGCSAKTM